MVTGLPDDTAPLRSLLPDREWNALGAGAEAQRPRLVARALVRRVLGEQLGCPPADVPLARSDLGKPYVPDSGMAFSLSHTRTAVALAWNAADTDVGIDLDRRSHPAAGRLARRFFRAEEADGLSALEKGREDAFMQAWCLKEATLKCLGLTIAGHLNTLTVIRWQPLRVQAPVRTGLWSPGPHHWLAVACSAPFVLEAETPPRPFSGCLPLSHPVWMSD